ncbi:MAG TPA: hypothetical protein VJ875_11715 [Pyrinomonadaceae bacterium]|nr:hypothetical protein [Pyrinomonadaceae bacterium]
MSRMTLKLKTKPLGESKMGLTHVAVKSGRIGSKETYHAAFLVDTGSWHAMAPASELRKVGIEPIGKDTYELANGELQEFEYGNAELRFMDEIIATRILFGPDNSEPILGVLALQAAGFIVDPPNERVRKLEALPLK